MQRVYITGISGMLGGNLAYLWKEQFDIGGADLVPVFIPGVVADCFDLLDEAELVRHIEQFQPDTIIHTAAAVNVDLCEEKPEYANRLNVQLTKQVQEICRQKNIKLIYISTDAVFDGNSEVLYTEEDQVNPINCYGRTKQEGERLVLGMGSGLVVRTNIYGFNIQEKNSFGEWILHSLQEDKTLFMFEDIDFSPILVNDLAELLKAAMDHNLCGLYHICADGAITKYQFGTFLKECFGLRAGKIERSSSETGHLKAKRSKHMGMSCKKFSKLLGLQIRTPEEGIIQFKALYDSGYAEEIKACRENYNRNAEKSSIK